MDYKNAGLLHFKLISKRERLTTPIWLVSIILFTIGLAAAMQDVLGTTYEELFYFATAFANPAMEAMMGPLPQVLNYGSVFSLVMLLWVAISVGIMNIFFVIKHTRADEEKGRLEVLRSLPIGRNSILHAVMINAIQINAILAILTGIGLFLVGDSSMSFWASMLWGVYLGVVGYVFASVAALFAQLSQNSRGAKAYSFAAMGFFYILRAVGDTGVPFLSIISPLGIFPFAELFVNNNILPLLTPLAIGLSTHTLAYKLNSIRDIDQGFIATKKGVNYGKIRTTLSLSIKLTKTSFIWWVIIMFVVAGSYASIFGDIESFVEGNEFYAQLLMVSDGFTITQLFAGMIINIMAICVAIPVISFVLRIRSEEKENRADALLACPVDRKTYLSTYVLIAFASSIVLQIISAVGMYSVAATIVENIEYELPFLQLLLANIVYLPAIWFLLGLVIFLIGVAPKLSSWIWIYLAFAFIMMMFGRLVEEAQFLENISPMAYIPQVPIDEINWISLIIMTTISGILSVIGFLGYSKRDINV